MVDLERKVDSPDRVEIFGRQLTVEAGKRTKTYHREHTERSTEITEKKAGYRFRPKKGQRLNISVSAEEMQRKRKRAKPRSARRFTRELLYLDMC